MGRGEWGTGFGLLYSRPAFLVGLFAVPTESVNYTSRLRPALYPSTGVAMLPRRASQWPQSQMAPATGGGAVAPSPRHISNRRRRSSRLCSKRLRKGMRCKARWRGRYLFVETPQTKQRKSQNALKTGGRPSLERNPPILHQITQATEGTAQILKTRPTF